MKSTETREVMSFLEKLLICIGLVVLSATAVLGCECKVESPGRAIKRLRKTATVILVGRVTEVRKEVRDYHIGYWATLKVKKSWKSDHVDEITVFTEGGCMAWFETGRTYLVYARPDRSNRLSTNVCMRTRLIEYAEEDLKLLGKPQFTAEVAGTQRTQRVMFIPSKLRNPNLSVWLTKLELGTLFEVEGADEAARGFRRNIVELTGLDAAEVA